MPSSVSQFKTKPRGGDVSDVFTRILKSTIPTDIPKKSQEARDWYRDTAQEIVKVNERKFMTGMQDRYVQRILPGHMYCFYYDPKWKHELPYYDRFPMIFPIHVDKDYFLGINMHYLGYQYRARLMDALHSIVNNDRYDETTKLKLSYNVLNSAAKYKYFKPCIKKYLKTHVRSRFVEIYAYEWDIAMFLPFERFEKATKQQVWQESRKIISKGR